MDAKCPFCEKDIHLVGAKELKDEYHIGPNTVAHEREKGRFPAPWLTFQNRLIWLRRDVDGFMEARSRTKIDSNINDLLTALESLPVTEQRKARKLLASRLSEQG